ncbi:CopG family transcriptional regulator [Betaproteobacteria bacterium]|nr:CopG family transcriptional regulator [Betaproteobacteria bacterium]GHU02142.1 CopG family transcriptional regulator [Betaproteobacteria bacterium]GHU20874.1 CopG family transcriptional regulator [Betaproteobacteria bacterium]
MLYPVYIHVGDQNTAHGMTFPDFPGCFSAADEWQDIPRLAQEAVECHMAGEDVAMPTPSALPELTQHPDYHDGVWMLVDIDLSRVETAPKRVNISLPQYLLSEIDAYASAHGATRSGFLAEAARAAMR